MIDQLPVVADGRIERGDIVLVGDDHLPALLGGLLRAGNAGKREHERQRAARKQTFHPRAS